MRQLVISLALLALGACGAVATTSGGTGGEAAGGSSTGGSDTGGASTGGGTGGDPVGGGSGGSATGGGPTGGGSGGGATGGGTGGAATGGSSGGSASGGGTGGSATVGGTGGTADAGAPLPTFETVFSRRPAGDTRDTAIEDWLVSLIDQAVSGSKVRVAIYSFTRAAPAQALVRAFNRGVDVKIVTDGDADTTTGSEVPGLKTALGASRVHVCDPPGTACVGSGIMHHKTFLFSQLADGSTNVVVQASHNLTTTQLFMHNNATLVRGDALLFAAYEHTWNDLWADVEIPDYYHIDDGASPSRVYFFPRPTGGDTSVSILGNVTCDGTAKIRVAMAFFTDARLAVAQELAARAQEGCDVAVVAGDAEIPIGTQVASTLTGGGVALTRYPARTNGWSLHSKYVLIDAKYAGSTTHRKLVFTGSHNWTGPSLTINDETQLRVEDAQVYAAYLIDWAHVKASATKP